MTPTMSAGQKTTPTESWNGYSNKAKRRWLALSAHYTQWGVSQLLIGQGAIGL